MVDMGTGVTTTDSSINGFCFVVNSLHRRLFNILKWQPRVRRKRMTNSEVYCLACVCRVLLAHCACGSKSHHISVCHMCEFSSRMISSQMRAVIGTYHGFLIKFNYDSSLCEPFAYLLPQCTVYGVTIYGCNFLPLATCAYRWTQYMSKSLSIIERIHVYKTKR